MGLNVVAVDPDPAAPGLALATVRRVHDLADVQAILRVAREHRIDGILTMAADYPMPTVAAVCAELNLPGPRPQVVAQATNKWLMRQVLQAALLPCPSLRRVLDLEQAAHAVAALRGDTIFKPAMSHGGRGITRVPAGSPMAIVERAFVRARRETRADGVLVEEFVDGAEFSVESLTHQGVTHIVAVTDKITSGAPYYVELGHSQPSRWPATRVETLRTTAEQAMAALGIDQAAGHTEIRLTSNGPVIMEAAARLGGGFITSHLVPLSTGVDLVRATIRVALGASPDLTPKLPAWAAAVRFLSATPGRVTGVDGLEALQDIDGLEEAEIYVRPGETIGALVDASGRPGHVICSGRDAEHAIALAEAAQRCICIRTDSEPSA